MALKFPVKGGGGDFKSLPPGTYLAVCDMVVDLGMQKGSAQYPDPKRKLFIRFQTPAERIKFEKEGQKYDLPAVIGMQLNCSMHEKATMRKHLEAWRGKVFTDADAGNFDVASILRVPCMINVVETVSGDKVYSNVASISPVPKGIKALTLEGEAMYYDPSEPGKSNPLTSFPQWIQDKIANQVKPQAIQATGTYAETHQMGEYGTSGDGTHITDEDIPF